MITDWYRVLIDGGKIQASVPDIDELMKQGLVQQIYGIEQDHKWGYTQDSIEELFTKHGFKNVVATKREFDHRPGEPKLEITCQK